jgi:hypothetical protein
LSISKFSKKRPIKPFGCIFSKKKGKFIFKPHNRFPGSILLFLDMSLEKNVKVAKKAPKKAFLEAFFEKKGQKHFLGVVLADFSFFASDMSKNNRIEPGIRL